MKYINMYFGLKLLIPIILLVLFLLVLLVVFIIYSIEEKKVYKIHKLMLKKGYIKDYYVSLYGGYDYIYYEKGNIIIPMNQLLRLKKKEIEKYIDEKERG